MVDFIFSAVFFLIIIILMISMDKKKIKKIKDLTKDKFFIFSFIGSALFSLYALYLSGHTDELINLKGSVKHGILGFIIAFLAKLDLVIAPFWVIFLASYYLGMA